MSLSISYPYTTAGNYTFDSDKIEIDAGNAKLKLEDNPGLTYTQEFTNDTDFVFDPDSPRHAEVIGGQLEQIDIRPVNSTFAATYTNDIDGDWGDGVLTGTGVGSPTITGNKLDLTGGITKNVIYDANLNADSQQTGAIKFKWTPNYTGAPAGTNRLYTVQNTIANVDNRIWIYHTSTLLFWQIFDESSSTIVSQAEVFSPIAGTEYEIELNWDVTVGATRFFMDGVQLGPTNTGTGIRSSNIDFMRIGETTSDFYFADLIIFNAVQHTANYTPGYTISETLYVEAKTTLPLYAIPGPGAIQSIDTFSVTDCGATRYTLGPSALVQFYWDGAAWSISDQTYAQSNDKSTIQDHLLDLVSGLITVVVMVYFTSSVTQCFCSEIDVEYTGQDYPIDNPTIKPNTGQRMDQLLDWVETITKTGDDNIKRLIQLDNDYYYLLAGVWTITSTLDYSLAMTISEILAEKETLLTEGTGKTFYPISFLHSEDGETTPYLDLDVITYDFSGGAVDLVESKVWGYLRDLDSSLAEEIFVKPIWTVGDKTLISNDYISTSTSTNGYWEMNMEVEDGVEPSYLIWKIKQKYYKTNFLVGINKFSELTIIEEY